MTKHRQPVGLRALSASGPPPQRPPDLWMAGPELLGDAPAALAGWLTELGLLTDRIRDACGAAAGLRLLEERLGLLSAEQQALLLAPSANCLQRRVALTARERVWVYAESLIPEHTLERHPWLGLLGVSSLGAALAARSEITRGRFEFALLPAAHPLVTQALACTGVRPGGVWARRSWFALGGRRLLVQELFMPELGGC